MTQRGTSSISSVLLIDDGVEVFLLINMDRPSRKHRAFTSPISYNLDYCTRGSSNLVCGASSRTCGYLGGAALVALGRIDPQEPDVGLRRVHLRLPRRATQDLPHCASSGNLVTYECSRSRDGEKNFCFSRPRSPSD
jgi:hypothetical protein